MCDSEFLHIRDAPIHEQRVEYAHADMPLLGQANHGKAVQRIDVTFKRPVPLPATITLWQTANADTEGKYQVCGAEDLLQRLEGSYTLVSSEE